MRLKTDITNRAIGTIGHDIWVCCSLADTGSGQKMLINSSKSDKTTIGMYASCFCTKTADCLNSVTQIFPHSDTVLKSNAKCNVERYAVPRSASVTV